MRLESAYAFKKELRGHIVAASVASAHERSVARSPVAVGITPADTNGEHRIAIRAREKTAATLQRIEMIRARAAEEVDIRFTGAIRVQPATASSVPKRLRIGASVGHHLVSAGTLGCFVRDDSGNIGFISNNHVLANVDRGVLGDAILHPGSIDGGVNPEDRVATLFDPYPRLQPGTPIVDCAFALLEPQNIDFDPSDLEGGGTLGSTLVAPDDLLDVEKIGRTTGRTRGVITAFNVDDVGVTYSDGSLVFFDDQVEIESVDALPFSRGGDSGSLIFDRSFDPVALLFAGSDEGGTFHNGLTYANPFSTVLSALRVTLVT